MMEIFTPEGLSALLQVIMIDLVLAGDNALVIGMAAAGLPPEQRVRAIAIGIAAATIMRIAFAAITTQLLAIVGLLLAGGILLLWVSWKMWREIRSNAHLEDPEEPKTAMEAAGDDTAAGKPRKTFAQAAWQIVVADISMSLDNVLAVAGAAREHPTVLVVGLILSIALMGFAANLVARILRVYPWISYLGLLIIVYVAIDMIWRGWNEVAPHIAAIGMG